MNSAKVSCHVVLPVELLVTHSARVGLALEVGGDVVPVEVAWMCVRVVAHLAAVRVLWWPLVDAEAADADGVGGVLGGAEAAAVVGVEVGQLRLNLLLHLEVHQVWAGAGGAGLRVNTAPGAGAGESLVRRLVEWVHQIGDGEPLWVPEQLVSSIMSRSELFILLFNSFVNNLSLESISGVSGVATVSVRFLHGKV